MPGDMNLQLNKCPQKLVGFLRKKGFIEDYYFDKQFFGNEIYKFKTDHILIRILSDRSIWSIEISSCYIDPNDFYDFPLVMLMIENISLDDIVVIDVQEEYFINKFNEIYSNFDNIHYKETIEKLRFFQSERMKRRLGIVKEGNIYKHIV